MQHYRVCFDANEFPPLHQNGGGGVGFITYIIMAIFILLN